MPSWIEKANKYINKYWKIAELKETQKDIINELLLGNDVVGLLPTGYGKSLCYLLPPLLLEKTMIIVSPLIALMDDQCEKLTSMNIKAVALNSNNKNKSEDIEDVLNNKVRIVYMSPEYLMGDGLEFVQELFEKELLGFIAIDESHCISTWGYDFRKEYKQLKVLKDFFPSVPILAVTATATEKVCIDIINSLKLNNPEVYKVSFDRPNLNITIKDIPKGYVQDSRVKKLKLVYKQLSHLEIVKPYIKKYSAEKIIIYINKRDETEKLSKEINLNFGNISEAYHAGLTKKKRTEIHKRFISDDDSEKLNIIICTTAFGMGIDQTVRCVIIIGCPSSIEEYYQEIGRAGRDNKPSETIFYFDYGCYLTNIYSMKHLEHSDNELYNNRKMKLDRMKDLVHSNVCKRRQILSYFSQNDNKDEYFLTCNNCSSCCDYPLIDISDKILPHINKNIDIIKNEINKILKTDQYFDGNKSHTIKLDYYNVLYSWINFIKRYKLKLEDLTEKNKFKIQNRFTSYADVIKPVEINYLD